MSNGFLANPVFDFGVGCFQMNSFYVRRTTWHGMRRTQGMHVCSHGDFTIQSSHLQAMGKRVICLDRAYMALFG